MKVYLDISTDYAKKNIKDDISSLLKRADSIIVEPNKIELIAELPENRDSGKWITVHIYAFIPKEELLEL